jgi:hypothetical protein
VGIVANCARPTSSNRSSRPQRSRKSSPSGQLSSPRCARPSEITRDAVSDTRQALEGKDVKDLLLNVGSGGGAAAAPAAGGAGGAAASGGDAAPAEEEKKEEGTSTRHSHFSGLSTNTPHREGGVRRGHGLRSLRLSAFFPFPFARLPFLGSSKRTAAYSQCWGGPVTTFSDTTSIWAFSVNTITAS